MIESLKTDYHFDPDAGMVLSVKHQRIAQVIHDYNPELRLVWIPPSERSVEDVNPFAVVHDRPNGYSYPIMFLSEDEMDHRVLARIFEADMARQGNNPLAKIEANNAAKTILEAKEREDRQAEKKDIAVHILKSKLHKYRHGGKTYR